MPGRTPQSPDDRGTPAPAPTDSGICAISPSDLVGYTGNLINRVEELEQRIAELEAKNVEANQLSDLSQQVGWVDGITYMGVPGWTQTEYGTLIPPAGWTFMGNGLTLSDGNTYQGVYFDEDGVLQFGFEAGGTGITGALPTAWNAAAAGSADYARYSYENLSGSTTNSESRGASITSTDTAGLVGHIEIAIATSGLYHVSSFLGRHFSGSLFSTVSGGINLKVWNTSTSQVMRSEEIGGQRELISDIALETSCAGDMLCDAGDVVKAEFTLSVGSGITSDTLTSFSLSVVRISA